ncbi:LamG-like jellyroll fold domain-containing protein [Micromonospora sp. NPDC003197]
MAGVVVLPASPAAASVPNAPTNQLSDGKPCVTGPGRPYVLTTTPVLAAMQGDPDSGQQSLTTSFYWWPQGGARNETDKLSQSAGNPSSVSVTIPSGRLTDGSTYVWQSRTWDGLEFGGWSDTCEFTVDTTPPPAPGTVTSVDYPADGAPHGGVGLPGAFEVAPPSERAHEVKEYAWTLDSGVFAGAPTVPARPTDHGATITINPVHDGVNTLRVWAKDDAGRFSTTPQTYTFTVRAPAGPAATWNFDEASGDATDGRQHGNTATLTGGATRTTGRGGVGGALSLNGSTAYATTTGPAMTPHPDTAVMTPVRTDTSFTVTARVRLAATGGAGQSTVVAANGSRTAAYALGYSGLDNRWRFHMAGADADDPALFSVFSDAVPTAGSWTHLAAVYDAATGQLTLYVNGVAQSSTSVLTGGFNATGDVTIGKSRWNGVDAGYFDGAVDDVRIYNYVETPTNLAQMAVPLQPSISFPNGSTASVGGQLIVVLDAGGDSNVTKFRYSVGGTTLNTEVVATTPGGTASVTIDVGSVTGQRPLYAIAVDDGNRVGHMSAGQFTVTTDVSLTGTVFDTSTFMPVAGAVVQLAPGGMQAVTGPDGVYTFRGIAPGTYELSCTYGGMSSSSQVTIEGQGGQWWDIYLFP